MYKRIIKKSKVNILINIILFTVLSAGIISVINTKSLNRTFSSIINKDIPELRIISEMSLEISEARIEIYRYVSGYEPSTYLISSSFSEALKKISLISSEEMPENILFSISQIKSGISDILNLSRELEIAIKINNSLKKAELSSNLLMQSSMLIALSDNLRNNMTDYILIQQIESKTDILKKNTIFSASLFIFLMLLFIFAVANNRILSGIVESRTKDLKNQLFELKLIKNNLQLSEQRFENLYNNAPVSYFSLDKTGNIKDVNNTWLKTLFYDKKNVINHPLSEFIYKEDALLYNDFLEKLIRENQIAGREIRLSNNKGDLVNVSFTGSIDEGSGYYHCVFSDITEQKYLEDQLRHTEKMSAIGQLAGGIAHDFNNQLAGIMGYADMIRANPENSKTGNYAENIVSITKRSSELVKQLLVFARKGQQVKIKTDIHSLLKEVEVLVQRSIDKKIALEINLNAEDSVVLGDPGQIINLFLNLAINSRDAMPDGGKIIITTESVYIDKNSPLTETDISSGEYIKTSVEDTGNGIPESLKNKIFEPFFTTKPTGKGTGMGLSIAYSTVNNHEGFIEAFNRKESGAVFSVYFPLITEKIDTEIKSEKYKPKTSNINKLILVVDDEEVLRNMASEVLSKEQYRILTAEDGEQALKIFREKWHEIDLVLLDLVMPKINGYDTYIQMKSINPEVKVIITTGYSFNENIPDLLKIGINDIIMKPYKLSSFLETISKTIENV